MPAQPPDFTETLTPSAFVSALDIISLILEAAVSYTHLRAHETRHDLVCRLLLENGRRATQRSVSYTHLTLPTICSV